MHQLVIMRWNVATALLFACVLTASPSAQSPPAPPAAIHCENCGLTGQRPASFDPAKLRIVPRVDPVFMAVGPNEQEIGLRALFVGRVLGTSPLVLEVLDSRAQQIDRKMRVLLDDIHQGRDVGTCGMNLVPLVAADVKATVSSLRFNDLVTGTWMSHRDPSAPDQFLGVPAVTQLQKIAAPIPYFHPAPGTPNCLNRSGRLLNYITLSGGSLTIYNDGGIQYSTGYGDVFAREGLSADELKDLLTAFGAAGIDAMPNVTDKAAHMSGSRLTLVAARYQTVQTDSPHPKLAPIVERLSALTSRALANARFVLKAGVSRPLAANEAAGVEDIMTALRTMAGRTRRAIVRPDGTVDTAPADIDKHPESVSLHGGKWLWPRELGIRLTDVPSDGLVVPWSQIEKHQPIYFALRNSMRAGLAVIDGDRLFEQVRLCQISPHGHDTCAER